MSFSEKIKNNSNSAKSFLKKKTIGQRLKFILSYVHDHPDDFKDTEVYKFFKDHFKFETIAIGKSIKTVTNVKDLLFCAEEEYRKLKEEDNKIKKKRTILSKIFRKNDRLESK